MGQPREIRIDAQKEGNQIVVHFRDSGPGLMPEDRGKIFHPQYSTKGPLGTGMGLYLTSQIVQGHKGSIIATSHSNGGAGFMISLPLAVNL